MATREMKQAWRVCATEIRARSGLGTGRLELSLRVGDGSGRSWRRYMSCDPPLPRKWHEIVQESLRRSWLSKDSAHLLCAAPARHVPLATTSAASVIALPFTAPPVPPEIFFAPPYTSHARDPAVAARLLLHESIRHAKRHGTNPGRAGSGDAEQVRHHLRRFYGESGRAWLTAIGALQPLIERLGLGASNPRFPDGAPPGHPGREIVRAQDTARAELEAALRAAYERERLFQTAVGGAVGERAGE